MKELYVIRATKDGVEGFLKESTQFSERPVVDNPLEALSFELPKDTKYLDGILSRCVYPGLEEYCATGVRLDKAPEILKIQIEYHIKEVLTEDEYYNKYEQEPVRQVGG